MVGDAAGVDVNTALAQLAADRDALRQAIERCESRIRELATETAVNGLRDVSGADGLSAVAELRSMLGDMQAAQQRALAELRAETAHARALAEEALRTARVAAPSVPNPQLRAMHESVERLQAEQARLTKMVAASAADEP
jgi:hypothetical protein